MNRKQAMQIVAGIESLPQIKKQLRAIIAARPERIKLANTWQYHARKMLDWLDTDMRGPTPYRVFMPRGNTKLPFYAFSSLAIADCPGRGDCVNFCFSLKAWRYPAAFFRQLQNSLLLRSGRHVIAAEFMAIPDGRELRLFVDGDFSSVEVVRFFMDLISAHPSLHVYGYSKSWREFLELDKAGYDWPRNYIVNKSSGSRWEDTETGKRFDSLSIVRDEFLAVKVDKKHIKNRAYQDKDNAGSKEYRAAVRHEMKAKLGRTKVFACPGNCGNCLPNGRHACGSDDFRGIAIGIGVH